VEFGVDLEPEFASAPFTYTVDYGDGEVEDAAAAQASFTLQHVYTQPGTYTVSVDVWNCDMEPLEAVTDSMVIAITDLCTPVATPTLSVLTPLPAYLANPVEFSVALTPTAATAPFSYTVDFGDEGVEGGAAGQAPFTFEHVYTQPGTYTVSVGVWNCDMEPLEAVTDSVVVSVTDVCATVMTVTLSMLTPPPAAAGVPVELGVDLYPANATPPFSYTVDLGDESILQGLAATAPFTIQHTYAQPGPYTVTIYVLNCEATDPISALLNLEVFIIHRTYLPVVLK
ncbi:MAG: PKD domain-containing protein, partial [Anaerolineae bacterium]|nr:PKD domain-containing protein [Anaerolineae bacterium]